MALTKKQLKDIQDAIEKRMLSFSREALGERALTPAELNRLKAAGLLRSSTRSMIADPYILGKIVAMVEREGIRRITYDDVLKIARKAPRTNVEERAIQFATEHAGEHIKGLRDSMLKDVGTLGARARGAALRRVQTGVAEAVAERTTISELTTDLFNAFENRYRDWRRVAHTEMNNAVQQGIFGEIGQVHGGDQLVFKRPNPDACVHCKRVYLKSDGITPKVFKLRQLEETNIGLKARDWGPTIGSVHPWCNCQLQIVPEGYNFVTKKVVTEPFKVEEKKYKKGSIVDSDEFASLDEEHQAKIGRDAILSYTGETAEPISKAEISRSLSDEDACICDH